VIGQHAILRATRQGWLNGTALKTSPDLAFIIGENLANLRAWQKQFLGGMTFKDRHGNPIDPFRVFLDQFERRVMTEGTHGHLHQIMFRGRLIEADGQNPPTIDGKPIQWP